MAQFISVETEGAPWVSNFPSLSTPPWKTRARKRVSVQRPCTILKLIPSDPHHLLWPLLAARPTQPSAPRQERIREHMRLMHYLVGKRERMGERTGFFVPLGLYILSLEKTRNFFNRMNQLSMF